jgi:hypothetical protein
MSGNDRGFSTDRLARVAFKLGYLPVIKLQPLAPAHRPARSRIVGVEAAARHARRWLAAGSKLPDLISEPF